MLRRTRSAVTALAATVAPATLALTAVAGIDATGPAADPDPRADEARVTLLTDAQEDAIASFRAERPLAGLLADETGLVDRIYGVRIAGGPTPDAAATAAIETVSGVLGAPAADFVAGEPVGIMHDRVTGAPKFLLYRFQQQVDGVDVWRSTVGVLVRNEAGFPVSWIGSDAKPVAEFTPMPGLGNAEIPADVRRSLELDAAPGVATRFSAVRGVVFAGHEQRAEAPRSAVTFIAESGDVSDASTYWKVRYVVDAETGAILHEESMVHQVSIEGTVEGRATTGVGGMDCEPEELQGLPYARVIVDGEEVFADRFGQWSYDSPFGGPFAISSGLEGRYFRVNNEAGPNGLVQTSAGAGEFVQVIHNDANASEIRRAEVNAYLEANRIRDWVLELNPEYPVIADELDFDINVNIDNSCNAFYNGSSINFFTSGSGCQNTAFASVVYHEYGHHMINVGGSGQGEYGEGMSDTVSALLLDDPRLGVGFFLSCSSPLRNADNDCQYLTSGCSSCGSAIHSCGQLLSGAVWDTYEALQSTLGPAALDYVSQLTINSILLHTGTSIDPTITVDFLTLDDDDDTILNGTPNYAAIDAGFGVHNMPAPELALVAFSLPQGVPAGIDPSGGTTVEVAIEAVTDEPVPGTAVMEVVAGGDTLTVPMVPMGGDVYAASFPAVECGTAVDFSFEVLAQGGETVRFPADAPAERFSTYSAESVEIAFADDFETDQGWEVDNSFNLDDGAWTRGVPVGGGDRGDPASDGDGSGAAYLTDNVDGNSDVDGGTTRLISPLMSPSDEGSIVSYWRWYSNTAGASPAADVFEVDVSDDGGATWTQLEIVGPGGPEVDGGWFYKQFDLADLAGFELNDQFRIRFSASDLGDGSIVEAAVDGVELLTVDCTPSSVPGDVNGDGVVTFDDLLGLLSAWGPCAGCPADLDGNGSVDFDDLLTLLPLIG